MKYTNFFYDPSGIHLSGSNFLLHQKGPKKPQSILVFSSRGWNTLPGACSDLDLDYDMMVLDLPKVVLIFRWIELSDLLEFPNSQYNISWSLL